MQGSQSPSVKYSGTTLMLAIASPLQGLLDRPGITHEFCNRQAVATLKKDGLMGSAVFFESYLAELNAGVYWADGGWKNAGHYFDPVSGRGLWHFSNALAELQSYYNRGLQHFEFGEIAKAVFFLGAAAHLLQDVCVPHHARAKLFCGHREYERWAEQHHHEFAVEGQGVYDSEHPCRLALHNALVAADLLEWVNETASITDFRSATRVLLPLAQRTTAGLLQRFSEQVGLPQQSLNGG
ncbi:phospholipase C [Propionispora hippei DSM 15287]|uniref:Phospholipase C n=1 Tax=Propionispora hippei DSM 15287 TaxID=1123003 RepID=A0A1M6JPJ1_9FIRM|nr:phospholipase C [Propionispora hippei DSM 15287]